VPADGTGERFWLELRALYLAADKPTLQRLVNLGLEQRPQLSISHSTINAWLNGKAVPTGRKNERYLTAMIAFLQSRVRPGTEYQRLPPGEWAGLLGAAQRQRAAQRSGRPRRGDGPQRALAPGVDWPAVTSGPSPGGAPEQSAPPGGRSPGALVGRDSELLLLDGLLRALTAGEGGTVLVEGEPGIGKSALVQAALAGAADLGCQVFWGTCSELDEALPLRPLLDAFHVRDPAGNPRRKMITGYLRGEISADRGVDVPAMLAEQLLALIAEECAAQPTVLVIDDVQWADHPSIRVLARLAGSARQLPLLLVVMMRPVPRRDDVLALRRAAGDAIRLSLTGLADTAVTELVGALAGGVPDAGLRELADDAGGNPLYLTELLAALVRSSALTVTDGVAALVAGPAPRSLTEVITDRLGFISRAAHEVLRSASLLGPEFNVTDLAILLDRRVAELAAVLWETCAAGLLAESGERLRFRHPLIHTALYAELPAAVRAAWHREAARALAAAGAPVDRVARQLLGAAGETGDTEHPDAAEPMDAWMLSWLDDAAEVLVAQAPQVAARLLAQAVASMPADSAGRGRLVSPLADSLYRTGQWTAAMELATRELPRAADPDVLTGLHWTLAQGRIAIGLSAESLATLSRALDAPGLTARHRGRLLVLAARTHSRAGQLEVAIQVADEALALAEETSDTWATGWALQAIAVSAATQGRAADALLSFDRGLAVIGDDPALTDLGVLLQINKAVALANLDRLAETLVIARQAQQLADQRGTMIRRAQAHSVLSQGLFEVGRWDDAVAEAAQVPLSMKEPTVACVDLGTVALVGLYRGDTAAARDRLRATAPHLPGLGNALIPSLVLARSLDEELAGNLPAALSMLTGWLDDVTEEVGTAQEFVPDATRLAVLLGDLDTARALASQSVDFAAMGTPTARGNALYCQGLLDDDPAQLLAAAERYRQAGRPLPRAKALDAAALAYARAGAPEPGQSAAASAAEIYDGLGVIAVPAGGTPAPARAT
jgi:tetratricopeptide (TPR) repeat protein